MRRRARNHNGRARRCNCLKGTAARRIIVAGKFSGELGDCVRVIGGYKYRN